MTRNGALALAVVGLPASVLALPPLLWLVRTWVDPAVGAAGAVPALLAGGLLAFSVTSPVVGGAPPSSKAPMLLLSLTAAARLLGQALGVDLVSALALVADAMAVGLLLRLRDRARAVDPLGLAMLVGLSLPIERVVQRLAGFPMQVVAAAGAERSLRLVLDVTREGTRLVVGGHDVAVDLPCAGARGLMLALSLVSVLGAILRPTARGWATAFGVALASALGANVARVSLLAAGVARPSWLLGLDVTQGAAHEAIGTLALVLTCAPLLAWAAFTR